MNVNAAEDYVIQMTHTKLKVSVGFVKTATNGTENTVTSSYSINLIGGIYYAFIFDPIIYR